MKFIYDNINNKKYILKFHDVHLYLHKNHKLQYLFTNPVHVYKKYILDIDYYEFKQFVQDCIELDSSVASKDQFELECIHMLEKLSTEIDVNFKLYCCMKLGSLILSNFSYKNFIYLKKINNHFNCNLSGLLNSQIRYLIIILNNLIEINTSNIKQPKKLKTNVLQEINFMDFIYDYYQN